MRLNILSAPASLPPILDTLYLCHIIESAALLLIASVALYCSLRISSIYIFSHNLTLRGTLDLVCQSDPETNKSTSRNTES